VSWKKIAKLNKLKAPYQLEEGMALTVVDKKGVLEEGMAKSALLAETDESARTERQEKFEEDMAAISTGRDEEEAAGTGGKIFKFLILLLVLAALGYGAYQKFLPRDNSAHFEYESGEKSAPAAPSEEAAAEKSPAPAAEPAAAMAVPAAPAAPEISNAERAAVKVAVLNGSGIKGASGRAAALFKAQGYTQVSTGNAARFDLSGTLVECSSDISPALCADAAAVLSAAGYAGIEQKAGSGSGKITVTLGK
jgi:hypothetical protein